MAATERQWSIREDGCLIINKNLQGVTYHSSLNAIILSSKDQTITVLDATSGIVLQKSDLSGKNSTFYIADILIVNWNYKLF